MFKVYFLDIFLLLFSWMKLQRCAVIAFEECASHEAKRKLNCCYWSERWKTEGIYRLEKHIQRQQANFKPFHIWAAYTIMNAHWCQQKVTTGGFAGTATHPRDSENIIKCPAANNKWISLSASESAEGPKSTPFQLNYHWITFTNLLNTIRLLSIRCPPHPLCFSLGCTPPETRPSALTWPGADLVLIQVDVISTGDGRVLSFLSALAALLLLHLPLLWGHNSTGSPPGHLQVPSRWPHPLPANVLKLN